MENPPQQASTDPSNGSNVNEAPPQNVPQQSSHQNSAQLQTPSVAYQSPQVSNHSTTHASSPGLIVLQWLTYAFWGWTVLAMSFLTATVLANFIAGTNDGDFMPYAIAATLVLLPISVICDLFYSKQEPQRKTGFASVVMIIHAVIFAIFGIGALITIVVCLVQLLISSSASNYTHVTLYSGVIITFLYAAVFLRTLNITKLKWFHRFFIVAMIVAVGVFSVLGIVGPVANARITRNDSLIDNNLPAIQSDIDTYVSSNGKLPTDLNSIGISGDEQKLVTDNLVRYIPNVKPSTTSQSNYGTTQLSSNYYYKLCVNYKKSSASDGGSPYSSSTAENNYSDSINTLDHPAGSYCYKVSSPTINGNGIISE